MQTTSTHHTHSNQLKQLTTAVIAYVDETVQIVLATFLAASESPPDRLSPNSSASGIIVQNRHASWNTHPDLLLGLCRGRLQAWAERSEHLGLNHSSRAQTFCPLTVINPKQTQSPEVLVYSTVYSSSSCESFWQRTGTRLGASASAKWLV